MKKTVNVLSVVILLLLTGCARHHLDNPCPNFGSNCHKTPVNSWDYNQ